MKCQTSSSSTTVARLVGCGLGQCCRAWSLTQRSESNNARQRHWFARFRRRTCVVSRSAEMVEATMALFAFYHCNDGELTPALGG